MPSLLPLIVDCPLAFDYDPDTGLLSVVATGTMQRQTTQKIDVPLFPMSVILHLTPKISRQLLADLPLAERLLAQASEGPTKPRSVQ